MHYCSRCKYREIAPHKKWCSVCLPVVLNKLLDLRLSAMESGTGQHAIELIDAQLAAASKNLRKEMTKV